MAKGVFGETMTAASQQAKDVAKRPAAQWTGIAAAFAVALVQAYMSRDSNISIESKAAKSESHVAAAVEANVKAIEAGVKSIEELRADRYRLEQEFRTNVIALQEAVKELDARQRDLILEARVASRLRRAERSARHGRRETDDEDDDALEEQGATRRESVPPQQVPAVAALVPPSPAEKPEPLQVKVQPVAVPRVWTKGGDD